MELSKFTKPFVLPASFVAPTALEHGGLVATPLGRQHLQEDLVVVNGSRDLILRTRGGTWPTEELTEEFNFLDLAWHEREFRDGDSFAYAIRNSKGDYVGCFYLYPMGTRTKLSDELSKHDADVSWWVTSDGYADGLYELLHTAIGIWLGQFFPFQAPFYSNKELPK